MLSEIDRHVGKNLRALRTQAGVSEVRAAEVCGLSVETYLECEDGISRLGAVHLYHLCKLLDVRVSEFFKGLRN